MVIFESEVDVFKCPLIWSCFFNCAMKRNVDTVQTIQFYGLGEKNDRVLETGSHQTSRESNRQKYPRKRLPDERLKRSVTKLEGWASVQQNAIHWFEYSLRILLWEQDLLLPVDATKIDKICSLLSRIRFVAFKICSALLLCISICLWKVTAGSKLMEEEFGWSAIMKFGNSKIDNFADPSNFMVFSMRAF